MQTTSIEDFSWRKKEYLVGGSNKLLFEQDYRTYIAISFGCGDGEHRFIIDINNGWS